MGRSGPHHMRARFFLCSEDLLGGYTIGAVL